MDKMILNELHRERNYRICNAINLTSLGCVLQDMELSNDIDENLSRSIKKIAEDLLEMLRLENHKLLKQI